MIQEMKESPISLAMSHTLNTYNIIKQNWEEYAVIFSNLYKMFSISRGIKKKSHFLYARQDISWQISVCYMTVGTRSIIFCMGWVNKIEIWRSSSLIRTTEHIDISLRWPGCRLYCMWIETLIGHFQHVFQQGPAAACLITAQPTPRIPFKPQYVYNQTKINAHAMKFCLKPNRKKKNLCFHGC